MVLREVLPVTGAVFLLGWACAPAGDLTTSEHLIYEAHSRYNHIVVTEDTEGIRCLRFERDGALQSVVKVGDPDYLELPYVRAMLVGLAFVEPPGEDPQRLLMVGLGGGTIPRFLSVHFPKTAIDVVEIDHQVVAVAKKYFNLRLGPRLQVHVQDGRAFIEACRKPYQVILLDAYSSENIPYHLATRQFLEAVRKAVIRGGVVVGNVWSRFANPLYDDMLKTYQSVFAELYVFDVLSSGNKIFVALPRATRYRKAEVARRARHIGTTHHFPFNLGSVVRYGFRRMTEAQIQGRVLKDKPSKKSAGTAGAASGAR